MQVVESLAHSQVFEKILHGYSNASTSEAKEDYIAEYYDLEKKRISLEKFQKLDKKDVEAFFKNKKAVESRIQAEQSL